MKYQVLCLLLLLSILLAFGCGDDDGNGEEECDGGDCAVCDSGLPAPTPTAWNQITTGGGWAYGGDYRTTTGIGYTCGISDGELWCWGANSWGQLGVPPFTSTSKPFRVGMDSDWQMVSAGMEHTCGIRGGALYCWGANAMNNDDGTFGRLGLGADYRDGTVYLDTPTQVGTATDWVYVDCGKSHSCGIRDDGTDKTLWCWGRNQQGQLGVLNNETDSDTPVQEDSMSTDWVMVSANGYHAHTCGIRDDGTDRTLWCWGDGGRGELGNGGSSSEIPEQESSLSTDWAMVTAGGRQSCGIRDDGTDRTLWCWGRNSWGQLGVGDTTEYSTPQPVGSAVDWEDVSTGKSTTCGIRGGDLYCWGKNKHLQCGLGADVSGLTSCTTSDDVWYCNAPELADDTATWLDVETDGAHACAVNSAGLSCWGGNYTGQAGQPSGNQIPAPTPVN